MRHSFSVDIEWNEGLRGKTQPRGVADELPFSVPAAFGGPGGEWTPEHHFAAGVGTCILATFLTIAANSKLAFSSYRSSAKATMEQTPEGLRITEIELVPEVAVKTEDDKERALRLLEKSEAMCPISNSVTSKITFSPSVVVTG